MAKRAVRRRNRHGFDDQMMGKALSIHEHNELQRERFTARKAAERNKNRHPPRHYSGVMKRHGIIDRIFGSLTNSKPLNRKPDGISTFKYAERTHKRHSKQPN